MFAHQAVPFWRGAASMQFKGRTRSSCFNAVSVTGRLAHHYHARGSITAIHGLILLSGSYFYPLPGANGVLVVFHFHDQPAFENVKKLPRPYVMVARFKSTRRHALLDDREVCRC